MKKPRKRYSRPFEVHAEILKLKRSAKEKTIEAQDHEKVAKGLVKDSQTAVNGGQREWFLEEADAERKKAQKLWKSVTAIEESRIPRLVRTLQALGTQPMDFIKDDASVERSE